MRRKDYFTGETKQTGLESFALAVDGTWWLLDWDPMADNFLFTSPDKTETVYCKRKHFEAVVEEHTTYE